MKTPKISVIIPTRGRDQCLRMVLSDLGLQDIQPGLMDVWIVDQNDEPLTGLEKDLGSIKLHHEKMKPLGSHAGRNHAIERTSADFCLFVDDDVRIPPSFVRNHLEAHELYKHEHGKVVCIAGRVVQPKDGYTMEDFVRKGQLAKYSTWFGVVSGNFIGTEMGYVDHMHECNFSAQTKVLQEVGKFNTSFAGNAYFEGTDLALRMIERDYKIIYRPDLVLTHLQEGFGGNRVKAKTEHTYWYFRNLTLLNAKHMKVFGLPLYGSYSFAYLLAKSLKNHSPAILGSGVKGFFDGTVESVKRILSFKK